jgi:hypothetical protein
MVCAIRLSRQLLNQVDQYTKAQGFLPFVEYMFNTIAMRTGLMFIVHQNYLQSMIDMIGCSKKYNKGQ